MGVAWLYSVSSRSNHCSQTSATGHGSAFLERLGELYGIRREIGKLVRDDCSDPAVHRVDGPTDLQPDLSEITRAQFSFEQSQRAPEVFAARGDCRHDELCGGTSDRHPLPVPVAVRSRCISTRRTVANAASQIAPWTGSSSSLANALAHSNSRSTTGEPVPNRTHITAGPLCEVDFRWNRTGFTVRVQKRSLVVPCETRPSLHDPPRCLRYRPGRHRWNLLTTRHCRQRFQRLHHQLGRSIWSVRNGAQSMPTSALVCHVRLRML